MKSKKSAVPAAETAWTFFTNHAHVLLCLAEKPDMLLREVAVTVGVTERAVQKILADLERGGVLTRERHGRRNSYQIDPKIHLRHPVEAHCTVSGLINFVHDGRKR